MLSVMLSCHPIHRMLATPMPQLRGPMSMMRNWLHGLAVLRLHAIARCGGAINKVIAHLVAREDFWRNHPRADVAATVAQDKAVEAAFLGRPVFARRNQNRPPRRSGRSAENERVNAGTIENGGVRHLPRTFFHHLTGQRTAGEEHGHKRTRENIGTHKE